MQADYNAAVAALPGIQHHWPETEASGSVFSDVIGTLHGTWLGATCAGGATGPDGVAKAAANDGTVGRAGSIPTFVMPAAHTVFYWLKLASQTQSGDAMIFEWINAAGTTYVQHDSRIDATLADFSTCYSPAANRTNRTCNRSAFTTGTWVLVAATMDPSLGLSNEQVKIYVNATLVGTGGFAVDQPGTNTVTALAGVLGRCMDGATATLPLNGAQNGLGITTDLLSTAQQQALIDAMAVNSATDLGPKAVFFAADKTNCPNYTPITITGTAAGAQTNYPVPVTLAFTTQQADFKDVRFYDTDGTPLDFWRESYTASSTAKFWVRIPTTPANGVTKVIRAYYGDATLLYAGEGHRVFGPTGLFENFNRTANIINAIPHSASGDWITKGASGKWNDLISYAPRPFKNLDGTMHKRNGKSLVAFIGSGTPLGVDIDQIGIYEVTDWETKATWVNKSVDAPLIPLGASGTWCDADVQVTDCWYDGTKYIMYVEGNSANTGYDDVQLGVFTCPGTSDPYVPGNWTADAGNPILTFGTASVDMDGGDLYALMMLPDPTDPDPNKRFKFMWCGHSGTHQPGASGGTYGIMCGTGPAYNGPITKQNSTTYAFKQGSNIQASQFWKENGIYYALLDDADDLNAIRLISSPDGVTGWRLEGRVFSPGTGWDNTRLYWLSVIWDAEASKWRSVYTGSNGTTYSTYGIGASSFTGPRFRVLSLDDDKWAQASATLESGAAGEAKLAGAGASINSKQLFGTGTACRTRVKAVTGASNFGYLGGYRNLINGGTDVEIGVHRWHNSTPRLVVYDHRTADVADESTTTRGTMDTYGVIEVRRLSNKISYYLNDVLENKYGGGVLEDTVQYPTADLGVIAYASAAANPTYLDWIAVRKYVSPEPTVSVGAEVFVGGALATSASATATFSGQKGAASTVTASADATASAAGTKGAQGAINTTAGSSTTAAGTKGAQGAINTTAGSSTTAAGYKGASSSTQSSAIAQATFIGKAAASGSMSVPSSAIASFAGYKGVSAAVSIGANVRVTFAGTQSGIGVSPRAVIARTVRLRDTLKTHTSSK